MQSLVYSVFIYPMIFILPAYVANAAPVVFGGGTPIDMGRKIWGKAIFGRHKTIRGLVAGLLAGFAVAFIESMFISYMLFSGIMLSIGAHAGDLAGSFVKRRIGKKEGEEWPIFDQYLFVAFALAFALPFGRMPNLWGIIFILLITGVLHRLMNVLAHKAKIKDVPW